VKTSLFLPHNSLNDIRCPDFYGMNADSASGEGAIAQRIAAPQGGSCSTNPSLLGPTQWTNAYSASAIKVEVKVALARFEPHGSAA
jgi:hypothetical protein